MCGIAGAIGHLDASVREGIRRATAAMAHRGPDGAGSWSSLRDGDGEGVILGHRRLAILDLSPKGAQPMRDETSGNAIVYNGEVYNSPALREELRAEGVEFRSRTDTEVILKAYGRWGSRAVRRLRGMFAFALWDPSERTLLLARDRLGIKPLYAYHRAGPDGTGTLLFASEVRALLASGLVPRRLDGTGLWTYLWNGVVPGPRTLLRGVRLVNPGTWTAVGLSSLEVRSEPFWRLPSPGPDARDSPDLEETLRETVGIHLLSDVPIAVFLSGGIDSSSVAALAVAASGGPVHTLSVGFEEGAFDESRHAREVARLLGTVHREIRLTEGEFRRDLGEALAALDQPTCDGLNTYFVSRAVRGTGIKVALAGTGGDELFGGYGTFSELPRIRRWVRRARALPPRLLGKAARTLVGMRYGFHRAVPPQVRWGKLPALLSSGGGLLALYQVSRGLFTPAFLAELLPEGPGGPTDWGLTADRAADLESAIRETGELHAISLLELSCFLGDRLLRDTDSVGMAAGLEVRVPLLDHVLLERVAGLGERDRFHPVGEKRRLRSSALAGIDGARFDRPKAGFVLPIESWSRRSLRPVVAEVLEDPEGSRALGLRHSALLALWKSYERGCPGLHWSRVWAAFVLKWWCREHRVAA